MNIRILIYWVIVAIPLTWGVLQSVNAALPLFGGKSIYIPGLTVPPPPPAAKPAAASPAPAAAPTPAPVETATPTPAATAAPTAS